MSFPVEFLIASCVPDGGVLRFRFDGKNLTPVSRIAMPSPMWIEVRGDRLFALLNDPFPENNNSGVAVYSLSDGRKIRETVSTGGRTGCHLAVDGEEIYCANYDSGSLSKLPDTVVVHHGKSVDPERQAAPYVHSVFFSPDRKYVLSCDLGLDRIFVYDRDLTEISAVCVPGGSGPRHLVFSADGRYIYVINEMGASVSVLSWHDGRAEHLRTLSLLSPGVTGAGAAIRLSENGKRLYVTERTEHKIWLLDVNGSDLSVRGSYSCGGNHPRDLLLIAGEQYAVCANQFSDDIAVFRVETDGALTPVASAPVPGALCIAEIR